MGSSEWSRIWTSGGPAQLNAAYVPMFNVPMFIIIQGWQCDTETIFFSSNLKFGLKWIFCASNKYFWGPSLNDPTRYKINPTSSSKSVGTSAYVTVILIYVYNIIQICLTLLQLGCSDQEQKPCHK